MARNSVKVEEVQCPACGPAAYSIWIADCQQTRYVKCKSCGTIYSSPRVSWESRYAWLDNAFSLGENAIENARSRQHDLDHEAEIIQLHCSGGCLLDIGCDLGNFFQSFTEAEWKRYGVEVSPSAAEYAAREYNAEIFTGTVRQAGYPDAFFDVVTLLDTLYYMDDPREDFKEIFQIMRPGGIFAIEITGINYQMLRSRGILSLITDKKWTRLHSDSSYIFWFSPEGLLKLVSGCGFTIKEIYPISSPAAERGVFYKNASRLYSGITKGLVRTSRRFLRWLPKYMVVAQKPG